MKAQEADTLGAQIGTLIQDGWAEQAYALLAPVLAQRTPFRLLDRIGRTVGAVPLAGLNPFLDRIAAEPAEGSWVIIGSALGQQLDCDPESALSRCRGFVVAADVWYGADILAERVPGPALVASFDAALAQLGPWRGEANRWVRRTVGVAVHFWAKRSRGAAEFSAQAEALLRWLDPLFEEQETDAVKGVGWGFKTLGKHYPGLVSDWLVQQVVERRRRPRALMIRKAITYLPIDRQSLSMDRQSLSMDRQSLSTDKQSLSAPLRKESSKPENTN
jgi:hypothetical protein